MNETCPLELGVATSVSALPELCRLVCKESMQQGELFVNVGEVLPSKNQSECSHDSHSPTDIESAVRVGRSFLTAPAPDATVSRTLMAEHECDDCGATLDVDINFDCRNTPGYQTA